MAKTYTHPPGASKVYGPFRLKGSGWGDDIYSEVEFSISPETDIELSDDNFDGKEATVRVTGGKQGVTYALTIHYLTAGAHKSSRVLVLECGPVFV